MPNRRTPSSPSEAPPETAVATRSDAAYRLLFERNPLPMWVIDRQTRRFLAANRAAVQAYGYSEEEFRGMTIFDIRPPEERAKLEAYLDSVPASIPSPMPTIWRHQRRNGEVFEVEIVSDAIEFEGSTARLVMAKDVSQLRRAEAELVASERRYRSIVETAREGIWTVDTESRTTFVNDALARMLGYAPGEMLNRPLQDFMEEAVRSDAERNLERQRCGIAEQHEFRFRHRDGRAVWTLMATNPILDEQGRYAGALAMVTDITERKQAAMRANARAELMTMVASGAPTNSVMEALVRLVEGELPGALGCVMVLQGNRLRMQAAPGLPAFYNQAADGLAPGPLSGSCGAAAQLGHRVISADITTDPHWAPYRPLAAAAGVAACWSEPIIGRGGGVLGTFGIYRREPFEPDAAEQALVAGAAQMAAIVIERKQADDALRESQRMESLGTLAGGIAHDFNNILGAILGNLKLLQHEAGFSDAARQRLAQLDRSAQRARALVQQILAFSRREPQALQPQLMQPLVQESLALLRSSLPAGVRLDAQLSAEPLHIRADATQIQQVLMNLCSNAWHALQDDAGSIEVGLAAAELDAEAQRRLAPLGPGRHAHLWVHDNGSGMDEATRARIFEPFFTTKPVGVGTGLGLSVVHGIVTEHGGAIAVDTAPGRGSTFHLYFPLVDEPSEPLAATAPTPDTAVPVQPRHVLCVDDDEVMRLTEQGLLQSLGYLVTACEDGRQAIEAVRAAPFAFDLVVADYNMPELSGIDVARALAQLRPELPVIISSGYITEEMRAQARTLGVRDLVRKENTVDELGPAVQRALQPRADSSG